MLAMDPKREYLSWEEALELRRAVDPGIDDPERRERARSQRVAYVNSWGAENELSTSHPPQPEE
jgi:hypothetical protein